MPARPIRQNKTPWSDAEREVLRTTPSDKDAERILRQQCGQERARSSIRLERHRMEVESLRKDAERYRWLRSSASLATPSIATPDGWKCYDSGADEVVDAAMKAQP